MLNNENPYQAPQANLEEPEIQKYCHFSLFSAENRLGIIRFLLHIYVAFFLMAIMLAILSPIRFFSVFIIFMPFLYVLTCSTIKRLHDINLSGWWFLAYISTMIIFNKVALIAEYTGFIAAIFLLLFIIPSTKGKNSYGYPYKPNDLVIYVLFALSSLFYAILIWASLPRILSPAD